MNPIFFYRNAAQLSSTKKYSPYELQFVEKTMQTSTLINDVFCGDFKF